MINDIWWHIQCQMVLNSWVGHLVIPSTDDHYTTTRRVTTIKVSRERYINLFVMTYDDPICVALCMIAWFGVETAANRPLTSGLITAVHNTTTTSSSSRHLILYESMIAIERRSQTIVPPLKTVLQHWRTQLHYPLVTMVILHPITGHHHHHRHHMVVIMFVYHHQLHDQQPH